MPRPKTHTTGHDDLGYSIFIHNPELRVFSPIASMIYSTKSSDPVDLEQNADLVAHEIDGHDSLVPKQGSTVVMMEWPPGAHIDDLRSLSVTVGVMIQGQSISSDPSSQNPRNNLTSYHFPTFLSLLHAHRSQSQKLIFLSAQSRACSIAVSLAPSRRVSSSYSVAPCTHGGTPAARLRK